MTFLKNPIYLGVNIDHVATVRQARGSTLYPDPVHAAILAELAGADGITVHLREDRRHIQERDVKVLKEVMQTRLNFEMAATDFMVRFACELKPTYSCLVPEKREEITTEGGLDVIANLAHIQKTTDILINQDIQVSLFIDPDEAQIEATLKTGAKIIELHTGEYAGAKSNQQKMACLQKLQRAAKFAHEAGLQVNAGHGLHYQNVQEVAAIPEMVELNIGHAIVGHAIMVGFTAAVKEMKQLMLGSRA